MANPKIDPHDKESEKALLAAMLLNEKVFRNSQVNQDDFYLPAHQKIFQAMAELEVDGIKIDLITVQQQLKTRNWLADVGGMEYLVSLGDLGFGIAASWQDYAKIIRRKSAARKLRLLAAQLNHYASNGTKEIDKHIDEGMKTLSIIKEMVSKGKTLAETVKDWALQTKGQFFVTDCYRELGLVTVDDKTAARVSLHRLQKEGFIKPCGEKRGCYRMIESESPIIDFISADCSSVYPIKFPFELEKLVHIYPKNIIIVAGASNSGKTAFMLNLVRMNMNDHEIVYFSSETGPEEMKLRLSKFNMNLEDWRFKPRERSSNFADGIDPDALNIIDYLELTDNFFQVGGEIKAIFDRLDRGVAVIAIQKKGNQELARGAEFTLEKARLYLSMNPGELKIVKGKNWAQPGRNPNGMVFKFKLLQGAEFLEYE